MTHYWDVICRPPGNAFVVSNLVNMAKTRMVVDQNAQEIRDKYVEVLGETLFID